MTGLFHYAQLVRLPNVFTAWADILLAALATAAFPEHAGAVLLLLAASTSFYWGGMIWNDYFDLEQDRRERPFRPLPSGKVGVATAANLALVSLLAGILFSGLADWSRQGHLGISLTVGLVLTGAIFFYDAWLKRTWAGPLGMGACRFLNVLLGLTSVPESFGVRGVLLAFIVGLYIVGVTWFARTEARESNASVLAAAAGTMLAAALLGLALPLIGDDGPSPARPSLLFPYLLVAFILFVALPVRAAILRPVPQRVQAAVKRAVLGLVLLDAVLATAVAGSIGLLLALLLAPAFLVARWIYAT